MEKQTAIGVAGLDPVQPGLAGEPWDGSTMTAIGVAWLDSAPGPMEFGGRPRPTRRAFRRRYQEFHGFACTCGDCFVYWVSVSYYLRVGGHISWTYDIPRRERWALLLDLGLVSDEVPQ